MKKFLALAGVSAALLLAAPMTAQADGWRQGDRNGGRHERVADYRHDRHDDRGRRDGRGYHRGDRDHHDKGYHRGFHKHKHHYRHGHAARHHRHFDYWRPHLERAHFRHFERPVYHDGYYRVRARDVHGSIVILDVDAFSGTFFRVGF